MAVRLISFFLLVACLYQGFSDALDANPSTAVLQNRIINLRKYVDNLKARLDKSSSNVLLSRKWFFKRSDVYKGKRYYLSQQDPVSRSEEAMATCVFYGGYLVEIDDMDEMIFVKTFLKQFNGFRLVLTGATDEALEEVWQYRHSNKTVPSYLVKTRHFGNQRNCLYLVDSLDWLGVDDYCYYTNPQWPTRFLCEIPEPK